MYKEMDIAERAGLLARLAFQLDILDKLIKGPYVSGLQPCTRAASDRHAHQHAYHQAM